MTRKKFADYFDIPYRTIEDWENGKRELRQKYLLDLMIYKLINEGLINKDLRGKEK